MSTYNTQKNQNSQSVSEIFPIYKKPGETLAVLLDRFRLEQNLDKDIPITYAGRLDPMAEGLVVLLVGDSCRQKEEYLGLEKTYEFQVLFGISTDTFDMLGLIDSIDVIHPIKEEILKNIEKIKSIKEFTYPPYSSKPVGGIPLFLHAKAGTLPKDLPTMKGEIKELVLKDIQEFTFDKIINESISIIKKVQGDFRQQEILNSWHEFLKNNSNQKCTIATFEATVTSGVYVRAIATLLGQNLNTPTLAYSIKRTKIGK